MPMLKVVAVRDRAADLYRAPFFVPSVGTAIRAFSDHVNSKDDSDIVKHPEDFDLYLLADFDDESGIFECLPTPRQIAIGKDVRLAADSSKALAELRAQTDRLT